MKNRSAGPTLRSIIAANMGRILAQNLVRFGGMLGDPSRSGIFHEEVDGVRLTTTNQVTVLDAAVESQLTWDIIHPFLALRFVERRELHADGNFNKNAPYEVALEGDLIGGE